MRNDQEKGQLSVAVQQQSLYSSGKSIHAYLLANETSVSREAIISLRNYLSIKASEDRLDPRDPRLSLAREWLECCTGASDLFSVLEAITEPKMICLCLSILSCLLNLTTQYSLDYTLGRPLIQTLLSDQWTKKLRNFVCGGHRELCLSALKLLKSISLFAEGSEQRHLLEAQPWDSKTLRRLLHSRRKENVRVSNPLVDPDIRTLCIQLITSFISFSSTIKTEFIEHNKELVTLLFKGLHMDPPIVIQFTLDVLWNKLWKDPKVKRSLKISIFAEETMQHLINIYKRSSPEPGSEDNIPANVVHHFLLAICTHPGSGICFADSGWYPRQDSEMPLDDQSFQSSGKLYNKVLANVLKMLKVNEDLRQQELALRILAACPELSANFIRSIGLTLEPRVSNKWLIGITFLGSVVSLKPPTECFYIRKTNTLSSTDVAEELYKPMPPPLSTIVENIVPTTNLKAVFSKALLLPNALMQHVSALALARCLKKYDSINRTFRHIGNSLGEDENGGQWIRRCTEVANELRRRIPEFQVIIAFANACKTETKSLKTMMLSEVAQRLILLYQKCVSSLYLEARYDIGKSLQVVQKPESVVMKTKNLKEIYVLQELHVLRMIKENSQFIWPSKTGTSILLDLLRLYYRAKQDIIREEIKDILIQALRDSLLFQHDPDEFSLWLSSIPLSVRSQDSESPDGTILSDERECVALFLDTCMQRFSKTPHRYLEELEKLANSLAHSSPEEISQMASSHDLNVSPVLVTLLEQLSARIRGSLVSPSEALALTTFTRKLVSSLMGKQTSVRSCKILVDSLISAANCDTSLFDGHPDISFALKRECELLESYIDCCVSWTGSDMEHPSLTDLEAVEDFVSHVENLRTDDEHSKSLRAYELVDWIRLISEPVSVIGISRVAVVVKRLYEPALSDFLQHTPPKHSGLITLLDKDVLGRVSLDWFVLNVTNSQLKKKTIQSILQDLLQNSHHSLYSYKRFIGCILLRLGGANPADACYILDILSLFNLRARDDLCASDFGLLRGYLLEERLELSTLARTVSLPSTTLSSLERVLNITMAGFDESMYPLIEHTCDFWLNQRYSNLREGSSSDMSEFLIWAKFMRFEDITNLANEALSLLLLTGSHEHVVRSNIIHFFEAMLPTLGNYKTLITSWGIKNLPALLELRKMLPSVASLDKIIALSIEEGTPVGCTVLLEDSLDGAKVLHDIVGRAFSKWIHCRDVSFSTVNISSMLKDYTKWSSDTSRAITSLIYHSEGATASLWLLLRDELLLEKLDIEILSPVISALLDTERIRGIDESLKSYFPSVFEVFAKYLHNGSCSVRTQTLIATSLADMIDLDVSRRLVFLKTLTEQASNISPRELRQEYMVLTLRLHDVCPEDLSLLVRVVTNHVLQWIVHHLSDIDSSTRIDKQVISCIIHLVEMNEKVDSQYAEPVISIVIGKHIEVYECLHLTELLFSKIAMKPMNLNRLLQSILQNPHFIPLMQSRSSPDSRWMAMKLIKALLRSLPCNQLQASRLQPLIQAYSASLSSSNQIILEIFQLFEMQNQLPLSSLIEQWVPHKDSPSSTLDAVLNLDPSRLLATCLKFPTNREMKGEPGTSSVLTKVEDEFLYDPVFILLLLAKVLTECPPSTTFAWISLFKTNVIFLVIRCLSSSDSSIRKLAIAQLGILYKLLQTADIQEKKNVLYLFDIIRDQISDVAEYPTRLSSYITIFLGHALRGIFYPATFTYPKTARFLLQRHQIDIHDVPLLYSSLYSDSDQWKREFLWITRFLAEGMTSGEDWKLLKRRHTWDLLASLFSTFNNERALRLSILEFLTSLSGHSKAITSLILKSSLLQWIELQLQAVKMDEISAWAKIVENILVVIDQAQLERVTGGGGQECILRCISRLIHHADMGLLHSLSVSLSRSTSERFVCSQQALQVLEVFVSRLEAIEKSVPYLSQDYHYNTLRGYENEAVFDTERLGIPGHEGGNLLHWGRTVENLWGFATRFELKGKVWDQLSSRLLVWRMIVGEKHSRVGEWLRKQVTQSLASELRPT